MSAERAMTPQQARALRVAAQLLAYPDDVLYERLPLLTEAATTCGAAATPLVRMCGGLTTTPPAQARSRYVDTFDLRRKCCLYLTYFSHGDTRNRGMALLRFSTSYKVAGFEITDGELPDHLAVVCEFAAAAPAAGLDLLRKHRAGLELLRMALAEARSPYADVVDAICAVLPDAAPKDMEKALALARSGPPAEEVGLEPFGPPELTGGRR